MYNKFTKLEEKYNKFASDITLQLENYKWQIDSKLDTIIAQVNKLEDFTQNFSTTLNIGNTPNSSASTSPTPSPITANE